MRRTYLLALPAFLFTLLLTVLVPARAGLSQTAFPAKGGTLSVSADVTDANVDLYNGYSDYELRDANNDIAASSGYNNGIYD